MPSEPEVSGVVLPFSFSASGSVNGMRVDGFPGEGGGDTCFLVWLEGSGMVDVIQEPFRDDAFRAPLKVNRSVFPGAEEWNSAPFDRCEGVVCSRSRHPLADHDGSRFGPVVKHQRIRAFAAVQTCEQDHPPTITRQGTTLDSAVQARFRRPLGTCS